MFSGVLVEGVPSLVVRAVFFMHKEQNAWVQWCDARLDRFDVNKTG